MTERIYEILGSGYVPEKEGSLLELASQLNKLILDSAVPSEWLEHAEIAFDHLPGLVPEIEWTAGYCRELTRQEWKLRREEQIAESRRRLNTRIDALSRVKGLGGAAVDAAVQAAIESLRAELDDLEAA